MRWLRLAVLGALVLALSCHSAPDSAPKHAADANAAHGAQDAVGAAQDHQRQTLSYLEVLSGGARADQRLPMLVAVHGLGDSPQGFATMWKELPVAARIILPQAPRPYGRGYSWFSMDEDDQQRAASLHEDAGLLVELISGLRQSRPTVGRPVLTGFSQGGMLTFAVAVLYPRSLEAAFPVGGLLPMGLLQSGLVRSGSPSAVRYPTIVAFHGSNDTRVPISRARDTIDALTAWGLQARLREYPGVGHAISARMRRELFEEISHALPTAAGP